MPSRLAFVALGVLFLWAVSAQIAWSWYAVSQLFPSSNEAQMPFALSVYTQDIEHVMPEYANSGLEQGDNVESVENHPLTGRVQLEDMSQHMHAGDTLHMTVRRGVGEGSRRMQIAVKLHRSQHQALDWVLVIGLTILFPWSCLLVGFYIAFARPTDVLAWVTLAMLLTFSHIVSSGIPYAVPQPLRGLLQVYKPLVETWPLWLFYFGLLFPVPFDYIRRNKWPLMVSALPLLFIATVEILGNLLSEQHLREVVSLGRLLHALNLPLTLLYTAYIVAFFYFLRSKMYALPAGDARRRLQVMIWGCTLALVPLFPVAISETGILPRLPAWVEGLALLMLLLFPATMAYVIVVQQAMDVRMVVRTGVQYAIASNSLKVLRLVLVALLVWLTVYLVREAGNRQGLVALMAVTGTLLVVGLRSIMERVSRWMDRRFFREAYDAEQLLTDLSSSVASIRDIPMLAETVARRIAESLHVNRVAVLLDRGGIFTPVYAFGYSGQPDASFSRSASTIRLLRQMGGGPSRIHFEDPQSWVYATPASEQTALQQLNAEVLLPVTLKSRVLGLISLGPKRSEAPYSRVDLQLLGAVASQTGLALENAELTEDIRREVAQRERLDRELEIAREVQQRLFPQNLPKVDGLDFAGYCRPALGVGGDYYDFIHLSDGCLGLAIGDVSGKGIAAALMMASLQASLRAQTIKPCANLSEMIQLVNRLVYEASATNRYATFFYAQFDPRSRQLHYVNAGHNAPVLYRPNGSGDEPAISGKADARSDRFFRLDVGGTVLGLFGDLHFQEGNFEMQRGDVLVAFTDGISEAMDASDDEFGEDRLMDTLQRCGRRSAAEVASCLIEEVDSFVQSAPQHDDMTLLVMRMV